MKKLFNLVLASCLSLSMIVLPTKANTNLTASFHQAYATINESLSLNVENASGNVSYIWRVDGEVEGTSDSLLVDASMQNKVIEVSVSDSDETITNKMMVSKLPVLFIDTENNAAITSKEDYINANMRIQTNSLYPDLYEDSEGYDGAIEIRGRGNATWTWAKKPYKIKLDKKANLFGIGKNKHWVLLANFLDSSLMRNKLAYDLSGKLGMEYMQSTWVEVVLNGEMIGNYQLCEQVRVDSNRVDIYDWESACEDGAAAIAEANNLSDDDASNLEDLMVEDYSWIDNDQVTYNNTTYKVSDYFEYPDLSGGYLYELDGYWDEISKFKTKDGHPINYKNPEFANTSTTMFAQGQTYLQQLEDAATSSNFTTTINNEIYHYQDLVDLDSLISFWLVNELFYNADFMCQSNYMYKPHDSKIIMGPVWDMDWSSGVDGTIDPTNKWQTYSFGFNYGDRAQDRQWYRYLCRDPFYAIKAKEKYDNIHYEIESFVKENGLIETYYDYLKESGALDTSIWLYERDSLPFEENYEDFRIWMKNRINWLDTQFSSKDQILDSLADYNETDLALTFTSNNIPLSQDSNDIIYLLNEQQIDLNLNNNDIVTIKINGRIIHDQVNETNFTFTKAQLNELVSEINVMEIQTSHGNDIICFQSIDEINTTKLEQLIDEAKTYQAKDWGFICFANLQNAISDAESLLAGTIDSQAEVNNAITKLQDAILGLTIYEVNPNHLINKSKDTIIEVIDYSTNANNDEPEYVLDYDGTTYWHSDYTNPYEVLPQYITIDLKEEYNLEALTFLPRQDSSTGNGDIIEMNVYGSMNPYDNFTLIDTYAYEYSGKNLIDRDEFKFADLKDSQARYVKIEVTNALGDGNDHKYCSMGELRIYGVLSNTSKALLVEKLIEAKEYEEYYYSEDSFKVLQEAIKQGDDTISNASATQEDIDQALQTLITAISNLKEYENIGVDKRILKQRLQDDSYKQQNYTTTSWKPYQDALNSAQEVYDDENATQLQVDMAIQAIDNAIKNLIYASGNGYKELPNLINTSANTDITIIDFSSECGNGGTDEGAAGGEAYRCLDYDENTYWHSDWKNHVPDLGYLVFDLSKEYELSYLQFLPRQNGCNGDFIKLKVTISQDKTFDTNDYSETYTYETNTQGNALINRDYNSAYLDNTLGRYVKVEGVITGADGINSMNKYATMSEIRFYGVTPTIKANKEALQQAITLATNIDPSKYNDQSIIALTNILTQAQIILSDDKATQQQVDDITETLTTTLNSLVLKTNKEALQQVINQAKEIDQSKYTQDSINTLNTALENAQKVLADENATQAIIDETTTSLNNALKALQSNMNFIDVKTNDWFYKVVNQAYIKGLMSNTGKGKQYFEPNASITRGMVATVLYRMANKPSIEFKPVFSDVTNPNLWYSTAITWASQAGVVSGYKDGRFGPDDNITRQDLAIMLRNYAKKKGFNTSSTIDFSAFKDGNKVDDYAASAIAWCIEVKLMSGSNQKDGIYLMPKNNATRGECAKMFTLLDDLIQ